MDDDCIIKSVPEKCWVVVPYHIQSLPEAFVTCFRHKLSISFSQKGDTMSKKDSQYCLK